MGRSLLLVLIGAVAGAAVMYYVSADSAVSAGRVETARDGTLSPRADPARAAAPTAPSRIPSPIERREVTAGADGSASGMGSLLQALMAETDGSVLASMVRDAAASPGAAAHRAMELLLARYGEIDALAAMHLALEVTSDRQIVMQVYRELARSDPETALANLDVWAGRLPGAADGAAFVPPARSTMLQAALQELARQHPASAIAHVEGTPAGPERQSLLGIVARGYGRNDPEGALAWVQDRHAGDFGLLNAVLSGIVELDALRAVDAVLTLVPPMQRAQALRGVVMQGTLQVATGRSQSGVTPAQIGNRLLEAGAEGRNALLPFASAWAGRDPGAAMGWLIANEGRVDANAYRAVGNAVGQSDPAAAANYLHRVPEAVRSEWIAAIARGHAAHDMQQAMSWLEAHRGDPGYPAAVANVAQTLAAQDPIAAAGLLEGLDEPAATGAILNVASQWARRDPHAAASWALRRTEGQASPALSVIVQQWIVGDLDGARSWALGVAGAAQRDRALQAVVGAMGAVATPDARLLGAFSNDRTRQQAVLAAARGAMQRNPDEARALIDRHITDPDLRRQAEQWASESLRGGAFFSPGIQSFGRPAQ